MGSFFDNLSPEEAQAAFKRGWEAAVKRAEKEQLDKYREIKTIMYRNREPDREYTDEEVLTMAYEYGYKVAVKSYLLETGVSEENINLDSLEIDQNQFEAAKTEVLSMESDPIQQDLALLMYPRGYKNGRASQLQA